MTPDQHDRLATVLGEAKGTVARAALALSQPQASLLVVYAWMEALHELAEQLAAVGLTFDDLAETYVTIPDDPAHTDRSAQIFGLVTDVPDSLEGMLG